MRCQSIRSQRLHMFLRSVTPIVRQVVNLVVCEAIQDPLVVVLFRQDTRGGNRDESIVSVDLTIMTDETIG